MAKDMTRINLRVTPEAAELLARLAPSENKRGAYVEDLIRHAAQQAGLIEGPAPAPVDLNTAVSRQQFIELLARIDILEQALSDAQRQQQQQGASESDAPSL